MGVMVASGGLGYIGDYPTIERQVTVWAIPSGLDHCRKAIMDALEHAINLKWTA
jgi:hypothetical protein